MTFSPFHFLCFRTGLLNLLFTFHAIALLALRWVAAAAAMMTTTCAATYDRAYLCVQKFLKVFHIRCYLSCNHHHYDNYVY
jgi:hypothetical protein